MEVNRELPNLAAGLDESVHLLAPEGRMLVLAYHSLEDRMVKQRFADWSRTEEPGLRADGPAARDRATRSPACSPAGRCARRDAEVDGQPACRERPAPRGRASRAVTTVAARRPRRVPALARVDARTQPAPRRDRRRVAPAAPRLRVATRGRVGSARVLALVDRLRARERGRVPRDARAEPAASSTGSTRRSPPSSATYEQRRLDRVAARLAAAHHPGGASGSGSCCRPSPRSTSTCPTRRCPRRPTERRPPSPTGRR